MEIQGLMGKFDIGDHEHLAQIAPLHVGHELVDTHFKGLES